MASFLNKALSIRNINTYSYTRMHTSIRRKQTQHIIHTTQSQTQQYSQHSRHSHIVQQNKIIQVQPQHLFNIILDVDKYSSFLPFCNKSNIIRYSKCGNIFDAVLHIGGKNMMSGMFQEEYVSRVTKKIQKVDSNNNSINNDDDNDGDSLEWIVEAKSIKSSLFNALNSSWRLTQVDNGSNGFTAGTGTSGVENQSIVYTNVEFEVEISVSNPIISATLDASLEHIAKQQVLAFEKRCLDLQYTNI